jgi:hypothetical protein
MNSKAFMLDHWNIDSGFDEVRIRIGWLYLLLVS